MIGSYTYDPHVWPALITAILTAILGWYGWQRRNFPAAKPFAILCLFAFLWAVGCLLEVSTTDFSAKIFWIKFQGIWQMPEATTWPWFVLVYAGLGRWLTRRRVWLMITPPLLSFVVIVTNDYHHLLWKDFQMGEQVIQVYGIANWILAAYAFMLVLVTVIVLLRLAIRSLHLRWPAIIMLLGMVIAFGIYVLVNIDVGLLDPGERILFTMGILSLSFSVALFRFHALDPVPLARSTVIEQMREGMLVLDLQGRIVDLNPAAAKILGLQRDSLCGAPAIEVLPEFSDLLGQSEKVGVVTSEISRGKGHFARFYNLNLTLLNDRRGQTLGHLLLIHDETDQKRTHQQILEDQKVVATLQERERLARELHDSAGQVLGYVNLQTETIRKWLQTGNNEKADSLLIRLAEVAREAHADVRESILSLKAGSSQGWSFLPAIREYLDDFQSQYGIHTELVLKEGLKEDNFKPDVEVQLLRVIQEALTNSRKHSGAHNIRVTIERGQSLGNITITDDGSGFDPNQTNREASRHFGLAFMRERMAQIGGSLNIDSQPGAGTVVKLDVPTGDQPEETA